MTDDLISTREALERFPELSAGKIRQWIARGKLKAVKAQVKGERNSVEMNHVSVLALLELLGKSAAALQAEHEENERLDERRAALQKNEAVTLPVTPPKNNDGNTVNSSFTKTSNPVTLPHSDPVVTLPPVTLPETIVPDTTKPEITMPEPENPEPAPNPENEKTKFSLESYLPAPPTEPTARAIEAANQRTWIAELNVQLENASHGSKRSLFEAAAKLHGESVRTVTRYVERYREHGTVGLARKPRADKGRFRIPDWLLQLIISVLVSNPAASVPRVRRILELADPHNLQYRSAGGLLEKVSTGTIASVLAWLETIPALRYWRMNEKARKEFRRVWLGEVVAEHANAMWQLDMTRTDLFVWNPDNDTIFRTRVHAVIDVYSGAIPAFVFSQAEDQLTTNRTLMLALLEKPGEWRTAWNVYGKPTTLYWDNGKTYRSERVHQALEALGVNIVHSRARVSHTRGKIERFFGTLHEFCSTLPGYCGANVQQRDQETIAKLWAATRAWHAAGCPADNDPYPNRLLLEDEFKRKALLWLTRDYHQVIVQGGKTREQLFLESAPASSRGRYNFGDLRTVFAKRSVRKVRGNGTIAYNGMAYGVADASLITLQGMSIDVYEDDTLPEAVLEVNIPQRGFVRLEPMNIAANSDRARQYRRDAKVALDELRDLSRKVALEFMNPELRFDRVLENAKPTAIVLPPSSEIVLEREHGQTQRDELRAAVQSVLADGIRLDDDVEHLLDGLK